VYLDWEKDGGAHALTAAGGCARVGKNPCTRRRGRTHYHCSHWPCIARFPDWGGADVHMQTCSFNGAWRASGALVARLHTARRAVQGSPRARGKEDRRQGVDLLERSMSAPLCLVGARSSPDVRLADA